MVGESQIAVQLLFMKAGNRCLARQNMIMMVGNGLLRPQIMTSRRPYGLRRKAARYREDRDGGVDNYFA